jgi:hypothetical protein
MGDLLKEVDLGKFAKASKVLKAGQHVSLAPIIYPSLAIEFVAWNAMFHRAMEQHNGDVNKAVMLADEAISSSQPANRAKDLSRMQRDRKGAARLVTMLMSFSIRRWNANNYVWKAMKAGEVSAADGLTYGFLSWVVAPILPILATATAWDWWDDDDALEKIGVQAAQDVVAYQVQGIPLARDLVGGAFRLAQGEKPTAAIRTAADTPVRVHIRALVELSNLMRSEDNEAPWALADLLSYYAGIPAARAYKDLMRGIEQADEDGNPVKILIPEPKERK